MAVQNEALIWRQLLRKPDALSSSLLPVVLLAVDSACARSFLFSLSPRSSFAVLAVPAAYTLNIL